MSLASVLEHPGLALYSIPIVWGLAYIPGWMKTMTLATSVGYNNITPRSNLERVRDADLAARLKCMEGAHQNGLEGLPLWFAAVLAGIITRVDLSTMNRSAAMYIVLRAAFVFFYINQKTLLQSGLRSIAWVASTGVALNLLVKAAGNLSL